MDTQMAVREHTRAIIVPPSARKDRKHRLSRFANWMGDRAWYCPDLAEYRDRLLETLAPSSVSAHLSTVRARYQELARDRDLFYEIAAQRTDDILKRKALVDEMVIRLSNAVDPRAAPVKVKTIQDRPDSEQGRRLTVEQANELIAMPDTSTLIGLRDRALIALALCTGIRVSELSHLDIDDLYQEYDGEPALWVREGKGAKERMVPYGEMVDVLNVVQEWLEAAGITEGAVFRVLRKGGHVADGRVKPRRIQYILANYEINGEAIRPHDLRRTYARRLYDAGVDILAIQQNLGHADHKTTLRYIGALDAKARRPPAIFSF